MPRTARLTHGNAPAGFCALDFPCSVLQPKPPDPMPFVRVLPARAHCCATTLTLYAPASAMVSATAISLARINAAENRAAKKHAAHRLLLFRRLPPKRLCVQEDLAPNFEVERQKVICVLRREGSRRGGRRLGLRGGQPNYLTSPRCIHSPSANMVLVNRDM